MTLSAGRLLFVAILLLAGVDTSAGTITLIAALVGEFWLEVYFSVVMNNTRRADLLLLILAAQLNLGLAATNVGLEDFNFNLLLDEDVAFEDFDATGDESGLNTDINFVALRFQNNRVGDDLNLLLVVLFFGARLLLLVVLLDEVAANGTDFAALVDFAVSTRYSHNFVMAAFSL